MASIYKRGEKWRAVIRRKGMPSLGESFILKADAIAWARQEELKLDQGGLTVTKEMKQVTVRDVFDDYLAEHVPKRKNQGKAWAKNRVAAYMREEPALCALYVVGDVASELDKFIKRRQAQGVVNNTIRSDLILMASMFKSAQKVGVNFNGTVVKVRYPNGVPTDLIEWPKPSKKASYKIWDAATYQYVLKALNFDPNVRPETVEDFLPWYLALLRETGLRPITLLNTKPSDINLAVPSIFCPGHNVKNGEDYEAPINSRAKALLEKLLPYRAGSATLFASTQVNTFYRAYVRLVRGPHGEDFPKLKTMVPYAMRHTWTTEYAGKISDPKVLLKVSGRKSMQVLVDSYYQPEAKDLASYLD